MLYPTKALIGKLNFTRRIVLDFFLFYGKAFLQNTNHC